LKIVSIILRRELRSYFATPIAYVFIIIFLFFLSLLTFQMGRLYEGLQATLAPFFLLHPWLYLILVPAVSMRFWSEERSSGSIELLLTQPITLWQAVIGKFLAGWLFVGIALLLTFPIWITINYLGSPDNGTIVASYLGSFFMAGAYLAIGSFFSAFTRSQIIAFVVTFFSCFLMVVVGFPIVTELLRDVGTWLSGLGPHWTWLGTAWGWLIEGALALSIYPHFENITKGVLDLRDVLYFALLGGFFLLASAVVLEAKKSR
jgi:ABC-2 type transport system permease protein